jgi:hypothetical protein
MYIPGNPPKQQQDETLAANGWHSQHPPVCTTDWPYIVSPRWSKPMSYGTYKGKRTLDEKMNIPKTT